MEQATMVYDNPSVHSGRLRDRSSLPSATDEAIPMSRTGDDVAVCAAPARASDPLLHILGTMRMGAILVAQDGRVVYLNEGGKEALSAQAGLALRGECVVATSPETRRRFLLALNHACNVPFIDGALLLGPGDVSGRRRALRIVSMERLKAREAVHADRANGGLALLCLACTRSRPPDASLLGSLFGLTGAESALMAAIVGGERLHACAARRGVSLATVRAQLRNVFVKTGAATQSELTFIAWSIPGLWIA